jgi:hypothetical protein
LTGIKQRLKKFSVWLEKSDSSRLVSQVVYLYKRGNKRLPHVVLTGDAKEFDLNQNLGSLLEEREIWRIKIDEVYVERKGGKALLSAVVVEESHPQSFYILVAKNETGNQLTVRLDPSTDPIKTRGVKRSIALAAERLLQCGGIFSVERHNIQGYLDAKHASTL